MTFAFLTNADFDITLLSYDWQTTVTLKGSTMASLNLFDETSKNYDELQDCEVVADLLRYLLAKQGWMVSDEGVFMKHIKTLCLPGPGIPGQLLFRTDRA